jgi:hypothetical protein
MASISESIIQGLMRPAFDVQPLVEPLGMLLGGAGAKRAKEERQMQAIQSLSSAQTPEQTKAALASIRKPEDAVAAMQYANLLAQLGQTQAETRQNEEALAGRTQLVEALSDPNSDLSRRLGSAREGILSAASSGSATGLSTAVRDALKSRVPVNTDLVSQLQAISGSGNRAASSYLSALQDPSGYVDKETQQAALRYLGTYSNQGSDKVANPALVDSLNKTGDPVAQVIASTYENDPNSTIASLGIDYLRDQGASSILKGLDFNSVTALESALPDLTSNPGALDVVQKRIDELKVGEKVDYKGIDEALNTTIGPDAYNRAREAIQLADSFSSLLEKNKYTKGQQYALDTMYTTAFSSNQRAMAEFSRLGVSNDLVGRISDSISKLVKGTLTEESLNELKQNLRKVSMSSRKAILEAADRAEAAGDKRTARQIRAIHGTSARDL